MPDFGLYFYSKRRQGNKLEILNRIREFLKRKFKKPQKKALTTPGHPKGEAHGRGEATNFIKLSERYLKLGMVDTAMHICVKGLEDYPESAEGLFVLTNIYLAKGMLKEAKVTVDRLALERPDNEQVIAFKRRLDEMGVGPVVIGKPVSLDKKKVKTRSIRTGEIASDSLAELYLRQGNIEKAVEVYEEILKRKPHNEHVRARVEEMKEMVAQGKMDAVQAPEPGDNEEQIKPAAEESPARRLRKSLEHAHTGLSGRIPVQGHEERVEPEAAVRQIEALEAWLRRIEDYRVIGRERNDFDG